VQDDTPAPQIRTELKAVSGVVKAGTREPGAGRAPEYQSPSDVGMKLAP